MKMSENRLKKYEIAKKVYMSSLDGMRKICKEHHIARDGFSKWLKEQGIPTINLRAQKNSNIFAFDKIDSEESAYWLGFMFADGSLCKNKKSYNIELSLATKDIEHLNKFRKFARITTKLYIDNVRCRTRIGSKHMFEKLTSYGCTERKSLTLKFPDESIFKNKKLIRHFIRGYFDGDGCISYKEKEHKHFCISICGTEEFLNKMMEHIELRTKIYKDKRSKHHICSLSGLKARKLIYYIYDRAKIYLERKHNRYKECCRLWKIRDNHRAKTVNTEM